MKEFMFFSKPAIVPLMPSSAINIVPFILLNLQKSLSLVMISFLSLIILN